MLLLYRLLLIGVEVGRIEIVRVWIVVGVEVILKRRGRSGRRSSRILELFVEVVQLLLVLLILWIHVDGSH